MSMGMKLKAHLARWTDEEVRLEEFQSTCPTTCAHHVAMKVNESSVSLDRPGDIEGIFFQWDIPGILMVYLLYPSNFPLGYFRVMYGELSW